MRGGCFFFGKNAKKTPPWPLFNFMKFYGVLQILQKLLPLSQFLVYVDDIGIKMFRNLSSLHNMNSFFSKGGRGGGKIGLKLLKPLKIRNFSFFFNFDPFLYFSAPLKYILNTYIVVLGVLDYMIQTFWKSGKNWVFYDFFLWELTF